MEDLDKWSVEKVVACLERIVHQEILPSISAEDFGSLEYVKEFEGEKKVREILKRIYQKSDGKLNIYGDVDFMVECFWKILRIPEFITFSSNQKVEMSSECALLTPVKGYKDFATEILYTSKSNTAILVFRMADYILKTSRKSDTFSLFFSTWQTAIMNKSLRRLKNSYELIPFDARVPLIDSLTEFMKINHKLTIPKETIGIKWFTKLKKHFDPEEQKFFAEAISCLKPEEIAENQEEFKKAYMEIVFLIENVQKMFDRHAELFTPSSQIQNIKMPKKPIIREIFGTHTDFYFAKEVEISLKRIVKKNPSKLKLLKDLIAVESDEERNNGIVYVIKPNKFEEIVKKLGISSDSYVLLKVMLENDHRICPYPSISSYGTHCKSAVDAFDNIIYYLTVILKVFQRTKTENLKNVFKWIEDIIDSHFVQKPVFYMLELSKIDEIMEKARLELTDFLTEPAHHEVAFQSEYNNDQTMRELEILTKNLKMEKHFFSALARQTITNMIRTQMGPITIRNVYTGYSHIVRLYLQENYKKIHSFIVNQWINEETKDFDVLFVDHRPKWKPEEKPFSGWKKGFLNNTVANAKKQESDQAREDKKIQEPSCSTENSENQIEQLEIKSEEIQFEENRRGLFTCIKSENVQPERNIWSIGKVIACLKRIVHPEVLPSISEDEINQFGGLNKYLKEKRALDFLKYIYKKSNGKLEIYGSVNEMMESFRKIDKIPDFILFPSNRIVSMRCASLTRFTGYSDATRKHLYSAKTNLFISTFNHVTKLFQQLSSDVVTTTFFMVWLTAFLNKILRELKGSFDLISIDSRNNLLLELSDVFQATPNVRIPKGTIIFQWFYNLRIYFDQEDEGAFNEALEVLEAWQDDRIVSDQTAYKHSYAHIVFLIENTRKIFDRHIELFTPFSKLMTPSIHQKPVIRLFIDSVSKYFLAQEVKNAVELVMKTQQITDEFRRESDDERKLGIVYTLQPSEFEEILKKLELSSEDFVILEVNIVEDYRSVSLPIVSCYGTHCIPAVDAFNNIIYYLTVILKVFQRSKNENLQEVFNWIDDTMDPLFVEKPVFYLVDISKIDEIIDKARAELSHLLTESAYEVPFKSIYHESEAHQEIAKLTPSLKDKLGEFEFFALKKNTVSMMLNKPICIKNIYNGYSKIVRLCLQSWNTKYKSFMDDQWSHRKCAQPPSFEGQESNQEGTSEQSAEKSEIQQLREELKQLRGDNNRLQDKLEEKERLKNVAETSEKEVQKLRKELEESQKAKSQIEEKMTTDFLNKLKVLSEISSNEKEKSEKVKTELEAVLQTERNRLKSVTESSEKDIQKLQKELNKSEKAKSQLEAVLQTERNRLNSVTESSEKDIQKIRDELEKTQKEKSQLVENSNSEKKRTKNMDKDIQKLREDLEKSQKAKDQLEDGSTTQLEAVKINFEEKIQKVQNELEKSQEAFTNMEGNLKIMEVKHLEEIQNLKKDHEKMERENVEMEHKLKNLEKECEKSMLKNKSLMSENVELQGDVLKNTEFQRKIKEHSKNLENQHCGLVDSAWSKLLRLCSRYPESENLKEVKDEVMKMEDCLDEYVENVKEEYNKLRE